MTLEMGKKLRLIVHAITAFPLRYAVLFSCCSLPSKQVEHLRNPPALRHSRHK